jgi:hypothetical protein
VKQAGLHDSGSFVTRSVTLSTTSVAMPDGRTELQRYEKAIGRGVLLIPAIG